ncbi:MAG: acyltransferase family protein [Cyclobacteriaceae bacterium]|jgi:glucan biosynthesis protein C
MNTNRRYDVDWVRVIAIALLLIYHTAIGFQPWGMMIGFISSKTSWVSLWTPMTLLNIWRIPLLFFVSGMGVYFALYNRTWKQLVWERTQRILVPFVFGIFCIVPIHIFILRKYYNMDAVYVPDAGHLWFLGNIFVYVLLLLPVFYMLKKNEAGSVVTLLKKSMRTPLGLLPLVLAMVLEVWITQPWPYEMYVMTKHGFLLGLIAFLFGFCFMLCGETFWKMVVQWRWFFLLMGTVLYSVRIIGLTFSDSTQWLLPIESIAWVLTVLAFSHRYLNKPSRALSYLSEAAYPVYILHMIFLYLGSVIIFPTDLPVYFQYVLLLIFTFAGCFGAYEIIRRVKWIRPLFGLKIK